MKQFQLFYCKKNIDNLWEIWLGNRCCVTFIQKRQAKAFLAETNRWLTHKLIEINGILKDVYCLYRDVWFTMQNYKNGKLVNNSDAERKIKSALQSSDEIFERIGSTYSGSADNAWGFIYMKKLTGFICDAIAELTVIHKQRNNTIDYHNLCILKNRLNKITLEIQDYPGNKPPNAVEIKRN